MIATAFGYSQPTLRRACLGAAVMLHVALAWAVMPHWASLDRQAEVEIARGEALFEYVALPSTPVTMQEQPVVKPDPKPIEKPIAKPEPKPEHPDDVVIPEPKPVAQSAPAPTPAPSSPVQKGAISKASPTMAIQAEYPRQSQLRREEGTAVLRVEVLASGRCRTVSVLESTGYDRLDRAAVEAMKRARYTPALSGGEPVDSELTLRYEFRLEERRAHASPKPAATVSMR